MVGIIRKRLRASQVVNDSSVTGANVDDALETLAADIPTTEEMQDLVGAMVSGNTETGITVTYQDADGTIDFVVDSEWVQDLVGAMVSGNTETNITVTYQDSDGTIDFAVPAMSDTVAGVVEAAVQSEMETGTDTTRAVVPGRLHYHPSACKGWGYYWAAGDALQASYNVSSVSEPASGWVLFNWNVDFSSATYAGMIVGVVDPGGTAGGTYITHTRTSNFAAGTISAITVNASSWLATPINVYTAVAFGDL